MDVDSEPEYVKDLYGMDGSNTEDFGCKCLFARLLVERGVRFLRFIQVVTTMTTTGTHTVIWLRTTRTMRDTDKPIAYLLMDLKQRST